MPSGRPTKYTPETVQKILEAIRLGSPYYQACNAAGVSHETFCEWRRIYPEFLEAVKEAEGSGVKKWLKVIEEAAANGNWQAAAWKLERRLPSEFGRRDRLPVDVSELDRQFEAAMGELESSREADIPASPQSEAIN
jgi:transposase